MKKKPATIGDSAWQQRQRVWRHNSFSGHARMMEMQLRNMRDCDSVSAGTKYFIEKMIAILPDLKQGLKTRIDP